MIRKRYRNLDVAIIAAQCGVRLPKVLQLQVDYAWAKAMADNARGKSQRLNTLMPSAPERVQDVAAIVDETSTSFVQGTRASQPGSQAASSSSKGPAKGKEKGKDKGKDKGKEKGKEKGKDDKGKGKDKGFTIERRTMDGWYSPGARLLWPSRTFGLSITKASRPGFGASPGILKTASTVHCLTKRQSCSPGCCMSTLHTAGLFSNASRAPGSPTYRQRKRRTALGRCKYLFYQ
eukprot:s444_g3.t1